MADDPKTYTQDEVNAMIAEKVGELDGLKRNRDEALAEAKKLRGEVKKFEGLDPERAREAQAKLDDIERKRAAAEGDFKSLEAQLLKKMEDQKAEYETVNGRLRSTLEQHLIDAEAMRELATLSDSPGLLLPHVKARMKVVEEDGKFSARVVDEKGNIRIGKGAGSAPMTLAEMLEEMKQDKTYAPAFRGTGSSGGGATKSNAGGAGPRTLPAGDDVGASILRNLDDFVAGKTKIA